jgi:hypothetical protein
LSIFLLSALYKWHLNVKAGKTCLLHLINAALNDEIAKHTLIVVEANAERKKRFVKN